MTEEFYTDKNLQCGESKNPFYLGVATDARQTRFQIFLVLTIFEYRLVR
jgi:hypothetical protein